MKFWLGLFTVLFFSGCVSTKPSNFFVLSPISSSPSKQQIEKGPSILVSVDEFPGYLSIPQVVRMQGSNQLLIDEYDRWGEDLKKNFERTVAENLSVLLNSSEIYIYPHEVPGKTDYQISIDVHRFEVDSQGAAVLKARWHLSDGADKSMGKPRIEEYRDSPSDAAKASQVQSLSRTLEAFSRSMTATLIRK